MQHFWFLLPQTVNIPVCYLGIFFIIAKRFLAQCQLRNQWWFLPLVFIQRYFPRVPDSLHNLMSADCESSNLFMALSWEVFFLNWLKNLSHSLVQSGEPQAMLASKARAFDGCSYILSHDTLTCYQLTCSFWNHPERWYSNILFSFFKCCSQQTLNPLLFTEYN